MRVHILEQTRRNGDDLAAVKSRLDRVEQKLDGARSTVSSGSSTA
jgi:tetrahydromethanopterin S-methyltransferase subunit G